MMGNEISRSKNFEFQMAGEFLEVHHNIAIKLKLIFGDEFVSFEVARLMPRRFHESD